MKRLTWKDETCRGGRPKRTNAVLDGQGNIAKPGKYCRKRGRGTGKIPIVGVKERRAGRVYAEVMPPNEKGQTLTGSRLISVIDKACKTTPEKKVLVNTDSFSAYNILDSEENKKKHTHLVASRSKGRHSDRKGNHANGAENFLSVVKNGVRGVCHHISLKYLQRHVDEYSFRQNTRRKACLMFCLGNVF